MSAVKVMLYPVRASVDFLTAVTIRSRWPHFHLPFEVELLADLLASLRSLEDVFVMLLRVETKRKMALAFLNERSISYSTKLERRRRRSWLGLRTREVIHPCLIFSAGEEVLRWALLHFGWMDHLRVFVAPVENRESVEELLALPESGASFSQLLAKVRYAALFDYDWEYFYLIGPGISLSEMVNHFRQICLRRGIDAETSTEPKRLENFRNRMEKLTGLPLTSSSRPAPAAAKS